MTTIAVLLTLLCFIHGALSCTPMTNAGDGKSGSSPTVKKSPGPKDCSTKDLTWEGSAANTLPVRIIAHGGSYGFHCKIEGGNDKYVLLINGVQSQEEEEWMKCSDGVFVQEDVPVKSFGCKRVPKQ
uniref:Salivary secreted protein n=1 Tax=Steinernema glaseri TaxID=37863 RepID=A0A1I7Y568_9BILA